MNSALLNSDLSSHNESSLILNKFINDFDLCRCDETYLQKIDSLKVTYCHESLNCGSYIDYLLISKKLLPLVSSFEILDDACNISDHYPIKLCVALDEFALQGLANANVKNSKYDEMLDKEKSNSF